MANNEVKIKLSVDGAAAVVGAMGRAGAGIDGLGAKTKEAGAGMAALGAKAREAGSGLDTLGTKAKDASTGALDLKGALAGLATLATAVTLVKMADSVTVLNNQLKLATGSTHAAGQAYDALFDIAQRSRVSFTELGGTYASISRAGGELGISQKRLLGVTEAIGNAMTISGGSAASMNAALTQLSQGLASGTLRGDELNSVMEQAPRLAQALSDGLGVTVGELRKMGEAGEITANKVIEALEKSAPKLAAEVKDATLTVGQAFTVLQNETVRFVGDADKASGATDTLSKAMVSLAGAIGGAGKIIRDNETAFAVITYGLAGAATVAGITGLAGAITTRLIPSLVAAGVAAGPLGWITLAIGAIGGAAVVAGKEVAQSAQGMATSAAQIGNQIAAIDKAMAEGINGRGTKASEADKRELAAMRATLVEKKKIISQEIALRSTSELTKGLDTTAEDARLARHTQTMKVAEKQEKDLVEIRQKLSGVDKDYLPTLKKLSEMRESGVLGEKEYIRMVSDLAKENYKADKSTDAQNSAYKDFIKSIHDKVREVENEINAGKKLTESDKLEAEYKDALTDKLKGLSAARRTAIEASIAQLKADEVALAMRKEEIRVHGEWLSQRKAEEASITTYLAAQDAANASSYAGLVKNVQAMTDEAEAAAISAMQHVSLAAAVERVTIARLKEAQSKTVEGMPEYERLQKEIDKRLELLGLITSKDSREAAAKNAKDAADEWAKASDQINQSLSDALMNGFSAGKGFARSFVDSVKAMFNTMVLRPVISAIVGTVTGSLGLGGAANAATGGASSLLGGAGSLSSMFSGSSLLGGLGTSLGTVGQVASLTAQSMMGVSGASQTLAGAMAAAEAGGQGFAAMLGGLAPATAGIGLALAGVYMLAKKLDHSGTLHTGAGSGYSASGGLQSAAGGDIFSGGFTGIKYSDQTAQMTDGIVQGIVGILDSTAVTFGKTAGHEAATSFADDTSKDGAWGSLVITKLGGVMTDWAASAGSNKREFSDGSAGTQEYLAAISADVRTALDGIGLPVWATAMLDELGNAPSLEQLSATAQAINTTQAALVQMGDKLVGFADLSDGVVTTLIKAAGGIGTLAASASTYYANFYTEGEKTATTLASISTTLAAVNLATPATREAFRALVEEQMALGETGAPAVAALLKVSDAFASAVAPMDDFSAAMKTATTSVSEEIARLRGLDAKGGQASLMTQFATLTGQARAGDAAAMGKLPAISAALESASALNAVTAVDISRTRAWLAASLSATLQTAGIDGSHALGLASVPFDGYRAELHKGERVLTAQDNRIFSTSVRPGTGQSNAEVVAELRAVRAELAAMQAQDKTIGESIAISTSRTAASTSKAAGIMERITPDGDAMATRVAA